jgi:hypothetical protein
MEMPEHISSKKYRKHLQVPVHGELGIERLVKLLERRKDLVKRVEDGEDVDVPTSK